MNIIQTFGEIALLTACGPTFGTTNITYYGYLCAFNSSDFVTASGYGLVTLVLSAEHVPGRLLGVCGHLDRRRGGLDGPGTATGHACRVRPVGRPVHKTQDVLFFFISTKMMPVAAGIILVYVIVQHPHLGMNLPLAVWMIRSFLREMPGEHRASTGPARPVVNSPAVLRVLLERVLLHGQPHDDPLHAAVFRRAGGSAVRACRRRRRDRCRWWSRRAGSPGRRWPRRPLPR